jgi:hypothetical protein
MVAKYLNLKGCYQKLWKYNLYIQDAAFTPEAELERAVMVGQQGNDIISRAVEKLCHDYLRS